MKGRGACHNPANRFHATRIESDAEWMVPPNADTRVMPIRSRSLITTNTSPDIPFEQSINPYQGCEHGCIYCFARPSHAHLDLSPGLDFETRIFAKSNAPELLERELARPSYRCRPIAIGVNTDAYQPAERKLRITRELLRICLAYRQPVMVITKSTLIERDIDLLAEMSAMNLASAAISVTTLDHRLKRILEPRAAGPAGRLRAMESLALAGVPVSVMAAPVIPRINDCELEEIMQAARDHGACSAGYIFLRLPHEVSGLFRDWLDRHYPERAGTVMSLIRQSREGQDYQAAFGKRMSGTGPFAALIARRFAVARSRMGLDRRHDDLSVDQFAVPQRAGDQMSLL